MEGLPKLQHHIVGNVNNVIDGAHSALSQALLHPKWRRPNLDVLDPKCSVACTKIWVIDLQIYIARFFHNILGFWQIVNELILKR